MQSAGKGNDKCTSQKNGLIKLGLKDEKGKRFGY